MKTFTILKAPLRVITGFMGKIARVSNLRVYYYSAYTHTLTDAEKQALIDGYIKIRLRGIDKHDGTLS